MSAVLRVVLHRMREPSTWAGLALLAGVALPEGLPAALAAAAGALAVALPERGGRV